MLWLLPLLFLFAAFIYNPIYIELAYFDQNLSLSWLPRVFSGTARPIHLPWPKAKHEADREVKRKAPIFPKAYLSHLARAHMGALVLEDVSATGIWKNSPAIAALSYGLIQSAAGIWHSCHFLSRSAIKLQPFPERSFDPNARVVISLTVAYLIRRSLKRRFDI